MFTQWFIHNHLGLIAHAGSRLNCASTDWYWKSFFINLGTTNCRSPHPTNYSFVWRHGVTERTRAGDCVLHGTGSRLVLPDRVLPEFPSQGRHYQIYCHLIRQEKYRLSHYAGGLCHYLFPRFDSPNIKTPLSGMSAVDDKANLHDYRSSKLKPVLYWSIPSAQRLHVQSFLMVTGRKNDISPLDFLFGLDQENMRRTVVPSCSFVSMHRINPMNRWIHPFSHCTPYSNLQPCPQTFLKIYQESRSGHVESLFSGSLTAPDLRAWALWWLQLAIIPVCNTRYQASGQGRTKLELSHIHVCMRTNQTRVLSGSMTKEAISEFRASEIVFVSPRLKVLSTSRLVSLLRTKRDNLA